VDEVKRLEAQLKGYQTKLGNLESKRTRLLDLFLDAEIDKEHLKKREFELRGTIHRMKEEALEIEGRLSEMAAMNGISFASLDGELLRLMKRAGFRTINLSLMSTDDCLKSTMGRPEGFSDFSTVLHEAERAGLNVIAYVIFRHARPEYC
jgi:chromosome segregation ATPase